MFDIDELREKVDDLIQNRPVIFFTVLFIIFLFIAGLVILTIQTSVKTKYVMPEPQNFKADAPVIIPSSPAPEQDYYQFRTPESTWNKEEAERWFSYPDDKIMEQVEKANDEIINDLTGVAP